MCVICMLVKFWTDITSAIHSYACCAVQFREDCLSAFLSHLVLFVMTLSPINSLFIFFYIILKKKTWKLHMHACLNALMQFWNENSLACGCTIECKPDTNKFPLHKDMSYTPYAVPCTLYQFVRFGRLYVRTYNVWPICYLCAYIVCVYPLTPASKCIW